MTYEKNAPPSPVFEDTPGKMTEESIKECITTPGI
jgi:hypothetical protein